MQIRVLERSQGSYLVIVPWNFKNCAANMERIAKEVEAPEGSEWIIIESIELDAAETLELALLKL